LRNRPRFVTQEQNKLRLQAITKLFSTAAMTIATVVVVSVVVPRSPSASLSGVNVFADRITYQAQVVDPDSAINNDTLKVRLSNQLERYEQSLPFGTSLGMFEGLLANTQYMLEIVANKGFGEERLASQRLKTYPKDGGAILDVRRIYDDISFDHRLEIDVAVYNDNQTYLSFALEYAFGYEYYQEYESESSIEQPLEYVSEPITESFSTIVVSQYLSYETIVYLRLIGYLDGGQTEVIDEIIDRQAFELQIYAGIEQVTTQSIELYVYPDSRVGKNATYVAAIYRGSQKIDEKPIIIPEHNQEQYEMDVGVIFSSLRSLTEYTLIVTASFINPDTLRQDTFAIEPLLVTTSGDYDYELNVSETDTNYIAVVTLIDPHHNFQQFFYEIYQPDTSYPTGSGNSGFLSPENKTSTLTIAKPPFADYRIVIGVRNITNYYRYDVLYTMTP